MIFIQVISILLIINILLLKFSCNKCSKSVKKENERMTLTAKIKKLHYSKDDAKMNELFKNIRKSS